jgi:hypothetical protein
MKMKLPARILLIVAVVGGIAYGGSSYLDRDVAPVAQVPVVQPPAPIAIQQPVAAPVQEAPRQIDASSNRGLNALMNAGKK